MKYMAWPSQFSAKFPINMVRTYVMWNYIIAIILSSFSVLPSFRYRFKGSVPSTPFIWVSGFS